MLFKKERKMTPIDRETMRELGRQAAKGTCPTEDMFRGCDEPGNTEACVDCHIFHAGRVAEEKLKKGILSPKDGLLMTV